MTFESCWGPGLQITDQIELVHPNTAALRECLRVCGPAEGPGQAWQENCKRQCCCHLLHLGFGGQRTYGTWPCPQLELIQCSGSDSSVTIVSLHPQRLPWCSFTTPSIHWVDTTSCTTKQHAGPSVLWEMQPRCQQASVSPQNTCRKAGSANRGRSESNLEGPGSWFGIVALLLEPGTWILDAVILMLPPSPSVLCGCGGSTVTTQPPPVTGGACCGRSGAGIWKAPECL